MNHDRHSPRLLFGVLASVTVLLLATSAAIAAPPYLVTVLSTSRGGAMSSVVAINKWGQVAGINASGHAALWTPAIHNGPVGASYDLQTTTGFPGGSTGSYATALNDAGQVVGSASTASSTQAWMWKPTQLNSSRGILHGTAGATTTFAPFVEPNTAAVPEYPAGINNPGQIVGHGASNNPLMWTPTVPNGTTGTWTYYDGGCEPPIGINDVTDIVGTTCNSDYHSPYLYHRGLPPSSISAISSSDWYAGPNQLYAYARGMNQSSDIVITAVNTTLQNRVYLYQYATGLVTNISGNQWSSGSGINDRDQVVGAGPNNNAMLFQQGTAVDLNTLIPAARSPAQWYLSNAIGINNAGQIICTGTYNDGSTNQAATFLLTPM